MHFDNAIEWEIGAGEIRAFPDQENPHEGK